MIPEKSAQQRQEELGTEFPKRIVDLITVFAESKYIKSGGPPLNNPKQAFEQVAALAAVVLVENGGLDKLADMIEACLDIAAKRAVETMLHNVGMPKRPPKWRPFNEGR